ncbi:MAG: beta-galactosidase [Candidatus Hydrogenedentes bacterium]|nr:beta-galactosidase [Candidatus Hydrogenedentota bacterium]
MQHALLMRVVLTALCILPAASAVEFPWKLSLDLSRERGDPRDRAYVDTSCDPVERDPAWGRPLSGGPIRALFLAPRFGLGDVRALASELQLEAQVAPFWDTEHLGPPEGVQVVPGASAGDALRRLYEALAGDLDVIVAASVELGQLPPDDWALLLEKVRAGAGLVLVHHRSSQAPAVVEFLNALEPGPDTALVTRGIAERLTPEWAGGLGFVQTSRYGEGNVVELDIPGGRPEFHCLIPALSQPVQAEEEHYHTYLSLAARAVCWAAERTPPVRIERIEPEAAAGPDPDQVPVGLLLEAEGESPELARSNLIRPFVVHLNMPATKMYQVRTRLRQAGRGTSVITEGEAPLREGDSSFRVFAVSGSGEYYLDVWLLDGDEVVDWYSEGIGIDSWPSVSELTANKTFVLTQDTLGLTFNVASRPKTFTVLARAVDPHGRVVAMTSQQIAENVGIVQLGLNFADLNCGMVKVEVFASDRPVLPMTDWDIPRAAYAYLYLPVRRTPDPYAFGLVAPVNGSAEYAARNTYSVLASHGFAAADTPGTAEAVTFLAWSGLDPIARVAQHTPSRILEGAVREPCLNDPEWRQKETERLAAVAQSVIQSGARRVSLGDGNCLSEGNDPVCQSPFTVQAYWEYLRKTYGDVKSLNAAWGTDVRTWDAVTPPPEDAVIALKAYAPWVDFRLFMNSVFGACHSEWRERVRLAGERVHAGFAARAGANAYTGYDWPWLAAHLDWLAIPCEPAAVEQVRAARKTDFFCGVRMPEAALSRDPASGRWYPWYAVLHGMQELWLPPVLATSRSANVLPLVSPVGDWLAQAPELMEESAALRLGLAPLLLHSERDHAGIAILVSQAGVLLNHIETAYGVDGYEAHARFTRLLGRLGYPYELITPEQLLRGGLSQYKVLLLPMARALADNEVSTIRSFHEGGGCVIADVAPGAYTEHGSLRTAMPLDGVFGVQHLQPPAPGAPAAALVQLELAGERVSANLEGIVADESLSSTTAAVGGQAGLAPVWLLRADAGFSLLLNHPLPQTVSGDGMDESLCTMLDAALRAAGAQQAVRVAGREGQSFRGEVFGYTLGTCRLAAFLADKEATAQKLSVALPDAKAVYDVRQGKRISRPKGMTMELPSGGAALFAMLPYEVTGVTLQTLDAVGAGSRVPITIRIETKGGEPSTHLVQIQVAETGRGGPSPIPYYDTIITCANGAGEGFVRLALNERLGVYKLSARDLLSGVTVEKTFSVIAPVRQAGAQS